MKIEWSREIAVASDPATAYMYLADFARHPKWVDSLDSIKEIAPGDANGIERRYPAMERGDFAGSGGLLARFARTVLGRTESEIREWIPKQRTVWYAHPIHNVGGALLAFDLEANSAGGTIVRWTIIER